MLSTQDPTLAQRHKALGLCLLFICSGLLTLPLMATRTPRFDAFILIVDTAFATVSLVAALLLFAQFALKRSVALLVLASGFLFAALTTLPQLLRLTQGEFIDTRLRFATDLALPLAVIGFAMLRRFESPVPLERSTALIARAVAAAIVLAAVVTWISAAASAPVTGIVEGGDTAASLRETMATGFLVIIIGLAIGVLWWQRKAVLDLWLLVALTAWVVAVLIEGVSPDGTSFAWYCAHLYSLLAVTCTVLAVFADSSLLFSRLSGAFRVLDRDSQGRPVVADATLKVIANELNQPLFAITANADAIQRMLAADAPDLTEVRAALADITQDAQRVSRTISTAQRLLASTHEPPADIDVGQLVNECLLQLQAELLEHRVVCEVETPPHLPGIRGLRKQLVQLLVNLVTNSLEAMSGVQSRERRLTVRASRHDSNTVAISVLDSGVGIQPEVAARVFDPFFTTKPHRSGLGLAICRSIVDAHGGNIVLTPNEGRGTAFKIILPVSS